MNKHRTSVPRPVGQTGPGGHDDGDRRAPRWRRRGSDGMVITAVDSCDRTRVRLIGELDLASGARVRWALPRLGGHRLLVDLSRLTFIDAAGLSALLLARRELELAGRRLELEEARGPVRRVFELSGLGHLVDNLPEAAPGD